MASKKENLKFFKVNEKYIEYLKKYDPFIPDVVYANRNRFFVGVMFTSHDTFFVAPVSSNKQYDYFNTNYPLRLNDKIAGNIRFNYMIPVPAEELELMDFKNEDIKYQTLVRKELRYCRKHQKKIQEKAERVYERLTSGVEEKLNSHCCNFIKLEDKCILWEQMIEEKASDFIFNYPNVFQLCTGDERTKLVRLLNKEDLKMIEKCVEGWSLDENNPYHTPKIDNVILEFAVDSWIHGEVEIDEFISCIQHIDDNVNEIIFDDLVENENKAIKIERKNMLLNSKEVNEIKAKYPKGTRIKLVEMIDVQAVPVGTKGTVVAVDDQGQLHMKWDNGRGLALIPNQDLFEIIMNEENESMEELKDELDLFTEMNEQGGM